MKVFLIIIAVIIAVVIEVIMTRRGVKGVTAEVSTDTLAAEPEEEICLTVKIRNESRAIYPFVRYNLTLPLDVEVLSGQHSLKVPPHSTLVTGSVMLWPKHAAEKQIKISIAKRGTYRVGNLSIETGDFLGLKTFKKDSSSFISVAIYPRTAENVEVEETLGSIMGDHSVRRFVFEDPVLISGFREYSGREPMKDISWMQSARSARLMVKKYDYTSEPSVTVALDSTSENREVIEKCYSIARAVCDRLEEDNIEYDFFLNSEIGGLNCNQHYFGKGQGSRHYFGILFQLAQAGYSVSVPAEEMIKGLLTAGNNAPGIILILPEKNEDTDRILSDLTEGSSATVYTLYAKEEEQCM